MAIIKEGPGMEHPDFNLDADFNVSFRIMRVYESLTHGFITRFDVLLNSATSKRGFPNSGDQFNGAMLSSAPGDSNLLLPNVGVVDGMTMKAPARKLSAILRGLADVIDDKAP